MSKNNDTSRPVEKEPKLEGYNPVSVNAKYGEVIFLISLLLFWLIILNLSIL